MCWQGDVDGAERGLRRALGKLETGAEKKQVSSVHGLNRQRKNWIGTEPRSGSVSDVGEGTVDFENEMVGGKVKCE